MPEQLSKTSGTRTVLVADDDPDARTLVCECLRMLGFLPIEASDGEKAVGMCKVALPDLAVLDGKMPGLNGTEVCAEIKKIPGGELVPIILLTAMDNMEAKVHALHSGVDDYLTKPFNFQELQARVVSLVRLRDLNLRLAEKNEQLQEMQEIVIQQERQIVISQLAGTAAHQLGQPLSAIMLNCYLIQTLQPNDPRYKKALQAISSDSKRMAEMIEKLKGANAAKTAAYYGNTQILDIDD